MEITIKLDPLTAYKLLWLQIYSVKGNWLQPEAILTPLIHDEFRKYLPEQNPHQRSEE